MILGAQRWIKTVRHTGKDREIERQRGREATGDTHTEGDGKRELKRQTGSQR